MRHLLFPITTTTMPTQSPSIKPRKPSSSSSNPNSCNNNSSSLVCKHSHSATLDIFFLILVLISGTFLLTSYFTYIVQSLSLLLPPISLSSLLTESPLPYVLGFLFVFLITFFLVEICSKSRKCDRAGCKGLKKALEFDLKLQSEDYVKDSSRDEGIDKLPWKGGTEGNPDYECLRSELRKMAPVNGRAVLLFRARCGCPVAKLEGWGAKHGRKHKKGLALKGGGDRR